MNVLLLTVALLGQSWPRPLIQMSRDVLAFEDKAYIVLPPVSIAENVIDMKWSPGGKVVLFRTSDAWAEIKNQVDSYAGKVIMVGEEETSKPPKGALGIYSHATGQVRWATGLPDNFQAYEMQWTSETTAIIQGNRYLGGEQGWADETELLWFSAGTGKVMPLAGELPKETFVHVLAVPSLGMTMISYPGSNPTLPCFMVSASGQVTPPPAAVREAMAQGWQVGNALPDRGIVFYHEGPNGLTTQLLNSRLVFEPYIVAPAKPQPELAKGPAMLSLVEGSLGDTLVLSPAGTSGTPVVVCQQVELSELAGISAVAYTSQRTLWIRSIMPIDLRDYQQGLANEKQQDLWRRGHQVGFAFGMYMAENDDAYPGSDPAGALRPYLSKGSVLDGFIFTLPPVGKYSDLKDPSTTELGYFQGDGGRMVVFADTRSRWVPNK